MNYAAVKDFSYITSPLGNITREAKAGQLVDFESCPQHVVDFYIAEGYVDVVEEGQADASEESPPEDNSADVEIPEDWSDLSWPELRSLASKITTDPVTNKANAIEAIEAELARRGA